MSAPSWSRRALTLGGVAAVAAAALQAPALIGRLRSPALELTPLERPPGFRLLHGGATSGGFDPIAGIAPSGPAPDETPAAALQADLCGALFGAPPPAGVVAVAAFSDFHCPHCRGLTRLLSGIETESAGALRVRWREWPILGPSSELAARAALAAGLQGAYPAFHAALGRGGFLATPALIEAIATDAGLDLARLRADMEGPEVARDIAEARGLARLFGFAGTPALVVGRTVISGVVDEATLRAVIARERRDGPPDVCA